MHGFFVVLLSETTAQQDKAKLLNDIEKLVYPFKYSFNRGDEQPCGCSDEGGSPNPACKDCIGTGRTLRNPAGKLDYWVLGGRFDGYIHTGKIDPQKTIGDFFTELVHFMSAAEGGSLLESDHNDVEANVLPIEQIHLKVLEEVWITPDHGWVENIFHLTNDPLKRYKNHWAAGIDYHY